MRSQLLKYFAYAHLPASLQSFSKIFWEAAWKIERTISDSAEKTVAFRKLMEAKDCAVRAAMPDVMWTITVNLKGGEDPEHDSEWKISPHQPVWSAIQDYFVGGITGNLPMDHYTLSGTPDNDTRFHFDPDLPFIAQGITDKDHIYLVVIDV